MHLPRPTIFRLATLTTIVVVSGFGRTIAAQLPPPAIDAPSFKPAT